MVEKVIQVAAPELLTREYLLKARVRAPRLPPSSGDELVRLADTALALMDQVDALHEESAKLLAEAIDLRELQALYRQQGRCDCGEDEACLFVRERDTAQAEVAMLRQVIGDRYMARIARRKKGPTF